MLNAVPGEAFNVQEPSTTTEAAERATRPLHARWSNPALRRSLDAFEKNRPVALVVCGMLGVLLLLGAGQLGGNLPRFPYPKSGATNALEAIHFPSIDKIESLLQSGAWPRLQTGASAVNPFFTTHFLPPPPPPPPKPPATRKVEVMFQGFFETAEGRKHAFIKVGENLQFGPEGMQIVADLAIKEIGLRTLTLTNRAAQATVLEFNQKQTLEVPAQ